MNAQHTEALERAALTINGTVKDDNGFQYAEQALEHGYRIVVNADFDFGHFDIGLYVPEGEDPWLVDSCRTQDELAAIAANFRDAAKEDAA